MPDTSQRLFCFGLGYSARALADAVRADGWTVAGTCRSEEKKAALQADGIDAYVFDRTQPMDNPQTALVGTTHLLLSVPPDAEGDAALDLHGGDIAACPGLQWAGYLSTTGVYGDRDGGWVDETSDRRPTGPRGARRVRAEDGWLDLGKARGIPMHLFRLAGIYGPDRNALETVRSGRARRVIKPDQVFSRIHRDDIVQVLQASMASPDSGTAYNLCDDEAAPPQDVIAFACDLLGVDPPPETPFEEADLSPMGQSFYRDNKRVSNARIKEALSVALKWPTYREGLRGLLAS